MRASTVLRSIGAALAGGAAVAALAASAAAPAAPGAAPSRPLRTAVVDGAVVEPAAFARVRSTGATAVRLVLSWNGVAPAPNARTRPAGFRPADHEDPAYRWAAVDQQVTRARAAGLDPILNLVGPPRWAVGDGRGPNGGPVRPSAREIAAFARAAATRYGGGVDGLPRVRLWQIWNEPNLSWHLNPQLVRGRHVGAYLYRAMVNAFADAVKGVRADNVVIAGGLAPWGSLLAGKPTWAISPLAFMRSLLCVSARLRPTCRTRVRFDVWAHHPYTTGGPAQTARWRDDVSLGDLPEMRALLLAARRAGHVLSSGTPGFWVTEFSWDTRPPDPRGVPQALHARWVSEALYRMWRSGVTLVTWYLLRDQPRGSSPFQSGLYFRGASFARDRPKLALTAFRFPFVALRESGRTLVWGRTPDSRGGQVRIEHRTAASRSWRRVAVLRASAHGVFTARLPFRERRGWLRAVRTTAGAPAAAASLPFSLRVPPNRTFRPFGDYGMPNVPEAR